MENPLENLKNLINVLKNISFWGRLFRWNKTRKMLIDAAIDLQKFISENENLRSENLKLNSNNNNISKELDFSRNQITELAVTKEKVVSLNNELSEIRQKNIQLEKEEEFRKHESSKLASSLERTMERIEKERKDEIEQKNKTELEGVLNLKETWNKHQENVKSIIKNICSKHTIEYVDKVPFRGEPDNTLKICDEFVIFDAKSPATDDLTNFPNYLKEQTERVKKYTKQDNVKSTIFFVVPSNTLEDLTNFVFNLGDYDVFIISIDSLEQIILSLKKIEEYEFAEQLSPEDRDNICRILGKFAHITKRRIQIDSYFAKQFIELVYKSESDLPKEILDKVIEYEKSEKLNPPSDKRAKAINLKELEKDTIKLQKETTIKGIEVDDEKISAGINKLQLYKPEANK